jgi:hypothetical protein
VSKSDAAGDVIELALEIACWPPASPDKYARYAYVDWELIRRLRARLELAGIDWRKLKKDIAAERRGIPFQPITITPEKQ